MSHGGGRLSPFWQDHSKVVDSGLVSQLLSSRRRWIAKICLGARLRATTAVICERSHIASTTASANRYTDATSFFFTGPATGGIETVPAYWERSDPNSNGISGPVPACWGTTFSAGVNANSDAIGKAQLTHLISRDDAVQGQNAPNVPEAPMPDAPTVHDIATPRRMIGGRCRKWCISAQPASGKLKCAACSMCGTRFNHGEARLQQWCNRQTNHHYAHAHCVNGGLGHDHELFPKQATDQDAVDAVTRRRDTITRTAADTEVLLPFAQDLDQASTAAPPDDEQDLLGREEALHMDEEIMDFQWFEHVTWDNIEDLRGTTYVQPPTRFKFALQQAQHAILSAIIHNNPSSLASESAWKALVLCSWLLLERPTANASERNCAHFLDLMG